MSPPPHGPGHRGYHNYNNNPDPSNRSNSNSAPPTPPGSLPSPSFPGSAPNSAITGPSKSDPNLNNNTTTTGPSNPSNQSQHPPTTDRTATAQAASTLLTTLFPPYAQTNHLIASLSAELDALKARQRIWKRLAHAAVLFSSDHELRYSLLDKCNDLAECMKMHPRLRQEVKKMNEVELQLFSISSTAKQLVGDVEWVRAEDVRGFVEGVRRGQQQAQAQAQVLAQQPQGQAVGKGGNTKNGNQTGEGIEGQCEGGGTVQVRLDKGRGDVGRRLNYLMVTSSSTSTGGQNYHQGAQGGGGQGEAMMGEGHARSRRSSTTVTARTTRVQPAHQQPQPQSQIQSYIAAQAVAAAKAAAASASGGGGAGPPQPQQEEPTWSSNSATASAESSVCAGRASPGPSEGSSTGPGPYGPNRARWWDTVITDSDMDQRRRSESSRNNARGRTHDAGSDCEMEM